MSGAAQGDLLPLPAVPAGAVKKFRVDVFEHVTRVSKDLPATRVWSYGVNGVLHRGTGVSGPMVVEQGDMVDVNLVNGGSKKMDVKFQHSIDYHSSEVAPNKAFKSIEPGESHHFRFRAKHPGVFMYHCATQPVLMHTGAGMVGMMVVKPKNLPAVDRELWVTQQEFYVGKPGGDADLKKMQAKKPDAITFNGFANNYPFVTHASATWSPARSVCCTRRTRRRPAGTDPAGAPARRDSKARPPACNHCSMSLDGPSRRIISEPIEDPEPVAPPDREVPEPRPEPREPEPAPS